MTRCIVCYKRLKPGSKVGLVGGDPQAPACWPCVAPGLNFELTVEALQRGERVTEYIDRVAPLPLRVAMHHQKERKRRRIETKRDGEL